MSIDSIRTHAPHPEFEVREGCLFIGERSIHDLAVMAGQTPFFAYSRAAIARRIRKLRDALPENVELHYAIKANPFPAVVQYVASMVDGLDVASANEMRVALDAGASPSSVSIAGPGKSAEELREAAAAGILINVESERELVILSQLERRGGSLPRVAIRVNPDFELKSSGMRMGGGPKQFGIDAELVPDVLSRLPSYGVSYEGLHIFSGSQNLRPDSIIESQQKCVDLAIRLSRVSGLAPRTINIGGGFGIPYFPGEAPLDISPIGTALRQLSARCAAELPTSRLVLELGRYIVGEAGVYVCRVLERKISRGQVFLITDGGLHHHLAASGNFGQIIRKNYPVLIANKAADGPREVVSVVGPLCTPLDLLADRMEMAEAQAGDLVAVLQSGAYGPTASPSAFLGHPAAIEMLV